MPVTESIKNGLQKISGGWLIFIAAFCWSTAGAVVKSSDVHPVPMVGLRSLVGFLALAVTLRYGKVKIDKWFLGTLLGFCGMGTTAVTTFRLTEAVVVIAMQYTAPIWIFLGVWLLKKELDKRRILVMALIVAAIAIFLIKPSPASTPAGNLLAVLMGVSFAVMSVCMKRTTHNNPLGLVCLLNLGTAMIILPLCLVVPSIHFTVGWLDWLYILFLGVVQLSLGYVFYTLGIGKVTPQKATLLAMWGFVLTPIWAFFVVREVPTMMVIVACVLLISALLLDNYIDARDGKKTVLAPPPR